MKALAFLSLAALARGIVIPDDVMTEQLSLHPAEPIDDSSADTSGWEYAVSAFEVLDPEIYQDLLRDDYAPESAFNGSDDGTEDGHPHHPPGKHHPPPHHPPHHPFPPHHKPSNKTALEYLQACNCAKIFSHLLTTYSPSLTSLLNSTDVDSKNFTVLAPLDKGFKRLHDHFKKHHPNLDDKPKKPSNETIEKFLEYHVVEGKKPVHSLLFADTLPTLLDGGEELGGMQRLRLNFHHGLFGGGLKVNFLSTVVNPNHRPSHYIIHFLSLPLIPPPPQLLAVSLFPSHFSTLSLALTKTGLDEELADIARTGGTFFPPDNHAFAKLGPEVNAFLFNTKKGLEILKAILKYHVVVDRTYYSDAYYHPESSSSLGAAMVTELEAFTNPSHRDFHLWASERREQEEAALGTTSSDRPGMIVHADLPTLLGDKSLAVDTRRFSLLGTKMWVNRIPVQVMNGIAKDGVLHVPSRVIIPPHKKHDDDDDDEAGREWTVEEVVERMMPFVEAEEWEDSMIEL